MAENTAEQISREVKELLLKISSILDWRLDKVYDSYRLAQMAEILDVKYGDGEVVGVRVKVPSETRRDTYYYVSVGHYGAKCNCEGSVIRNRLCKHVVSALILWNMVNLFKYGKFINIDDVRWLRDMVSGGEQ